MAVTGGYRMVFGPTFSFRIERDESAQKSVAKSLKKRRVATGGPTVV